MTKYFMKSRTSSYKSLSIFWLKQHGYLDPNVKIKTGSIAWTDPETGKKLFEVGILIFKDKWQTEQEDDYFIPAYHYKESNSKNKKEQTISYPIYLVTTKCNYGGARYWFICPLLKKDGHPCGQRVGVLYLMGKYFGCRKCGELFYDSQLRRGKGAKGTTGVSQQYIDELRDKITVYYYKDKPTRKYRRLLALEKKDAERWEKIVGIMEADIAKHKAYVDLLEKKSHRRSKGADP